MLAIYKLLFLYCEQNGKYAWTSHERKKEREIVLI